MPPHRAHAGRVAQRQTPPVHVVHAVPQCPQFCGSLVKSTQLPPQHAPALPSHAVPHEPQFRLSLCVSAQYGGEPASQKVWPVMQFDWHLPPEHTSEVPQTSPQVPQFELSVFVFAQ